MLPGRIDCDEIASRWMAIHTPFVIEVSRPRARVGTELSVDIIELAANLFCDGDVVRLAGHGHDSYLKNIGL